MENKECLKNTRFRELIDKDVLDILGEIDTTIANEGLTIEPVGEPEKCDDKCKDKKCKCHGDKYTINVNINDQEIDPKAKKGGEVDVEIDTPEICPECGKVPCECKESEDECLKNTKFRQVIDKDILDLFSEIDATIANESK